MLRHKIVLGSVVCLLTAALVSQTLSQTGGGSGAGAGFRRLPTGSAIPGGTSKSPRRKVTDESREASLRGAVGATEEQWSLIKPKLEKLWQLRQKVGSGIRIDAASSSGPLHVGADPELCPSIGIEIGPARGSSSGSSSSYSSQSRGKAAGGGGGGGGGGGAVGTAKPQEGVEVAWRWWPSWGRKPPEKPDEKVCADLFNLLKDRNAKPEELKQKMDQLRKAREQNKQDLAQARKELRDGLTLDQEARMVALGWLE